MGNRGDVQQRGAAVTSGEMRVLLEAADTCVVDVATLITSEHQLLGHEELATQAAPLLGLRERHVETHIN